MTVEGSGAVRQHRTEVNGIRLNYRRAGEGPPVVLLHGFPETSYAWRKVMPVLAQRYTVIAPDVRGCGASDRPTTGYDKQAVASDIRALTEQLDLGAVNLVAHDVGMMVGYPVRFGAGIVDGDGLRVGYTMHQARDAEDGMHLHLRTLLPKAAPRDLVSRHLRHFAIEFTNWTRTAWLETEEATS